jgi:ABC-2 type transport system permease protein
MSALLEQSRAEVRMTLRRGESLLLTVGIPVGLLVFFSAVPVVGLAHTRRVDFVTPGILSLCVLSTAMVALGIATGFERGYGVLKRLHVTPLGRRRLLAAKVAGVGVVEVVQVAVVCVVAALLAWHPHVTPASVAGALIAAAVATVAFAGIGLALAGRLRPEANLAAANGLYLVLLLTSGMVVPLSRLPSGLADVARLLPAAALTDALRGALARGVFPSASELAVLCAWALGAGTVAALTFRFDPPR